MAPMFISREGIPISVDGDSVPAEKRNTIWIKEHMDVGAQNRMMSALTRIRADSETEFDFGAFNLVMMKTCILRWEGPDFKGVPCTPENIERLDPEQPLVKRVSEELMQRNLEKMQGQLSPNSVSPAGSTT